MIGKNSWLLWILVLAAISCKPDANKAPNVVIIIADDIGYSDFGCYGGEIPTPNIDQIAAQGIRFTQYYSENMCAPSRVALLTGRYHIRGYQSGDNLTIAEALSTHEYPCYAVGKWHNAGEPIQDRSAPLKRGFDRFFGTPQGAGSFFAPLTLSRDGQVAESEWENKDFYYTDAISDEAVKRIEETPSDKPLFLYTAYTAAHWPLHAPEEAIARHAGKYAMGWDSLRSQRLTRMKDMGILPAHRILSDRDPEVIVWEEEEHKAWQERRMEVYAAQIEIMDQGIGRILEALKRTGRLDNTLLMVLVDNGGCHVEYEPERTGPFLNANTRDGKPIRAGNLPEIMPGPEDTWQSYGRGWANASNTPFRLFKKYDHEGGIRVPLIVQGPDKIKQGNRISHQIAHVTDLLPTVMDAADIPYPDQYQGRTLAPLDGKSLLPILEGEDTIIHEALFWQHASGAAMRDGNWKLVRIKNQPWELYDLDADPIEMKDLAADYPEKVNDMRVRWEAWKNK